MSAYIDDLSKKIVAKASELGGFTHGDQPGLTVQYFPGSGTWQVWVPVSPPGQSGTVVASADTLQKAIQGVAREVGVL